MYNVVVADDEYISRQGLAKFVSGLGYNVLSTFKDGSEVIEYLQNNKVDIIITDIKMNKVDGLEVAKYVHENNLKTKIIIMSGYKIFEYAKKAIEYDAVEYLLKPVRMDDISKLLDKVSGIIDEQHSMEIKQAEDIKQYEIMQTVIAERFFLDVATGIIAEDELENKLISYNLHVFNRKDCYGIIVFELIRIDEYLLNKWHYNKERFDNTIKNLLLDKNEFFETFYVMNNDTNLVVMTISKNETSNDTFKTELENHFNIITKYIFQLIDFEIIIKQISVYTEITDALKAIYNIAKICIAEQEEAISERYIDLHDAEDISSLIIERAKEYIDRNYMNDIALNDIAAEVHLSPTYFSRFFKNHTGETLTDYIVKKRVDMAIEMLMSGKEKIYELSQKVGYNDSKYFYKVFKKYTGYSPKEYYFRKSIQLKGSLNETQD